jgi:deoxyribodipyrimidine photolyase-related protein
MAVWREWLMATGTLRVVMGDQLSRSLAARCPTLILTATWCCLAEVMRGCSVFPYHRKKLVLAAMLHFARALPARGMRVGCVRLDDAGNARHGAVRRWRIVGAKPYTNGPTR